MNVILERERDLFTIESCDYTLPLVHASIGQKWGGLYVGSLHFCVLTTKYHVGALSVCYLMGNTRENWQSNQA